MLIIKGHRSQIRDLAFTTDGMAVASIAGKGYAISLWEATTGERRSYLSAKDDHPVLSMCIHPNGEELLACSLWVGTRHWNLKTETFRRSARGSGTGEVDQILISPDGEHCFFVHSPNWWDGYTTHVQFYSLRGRKTDHRSRQLASFGARFGGARCRSMSLTPDKRFLATALQAGQQKEIRLLDLNQSRSKAVDLGDGQAVAFSPNGELLAIAVGEQIHLLSVSDLSRISELRGHTQSVDHLAFSADGEKLLTGGEDQTVRMWDLASESEEQCYDWGIGQISRVRFAPDGMRAAAGGEKQIVIWDVD